MFSFVDVALIINDELKKKIKRPVLRISPRQALALSSLMQPHQKKSAFSGARTSKKHQGTGMRSGPRTPRGVFRWRCSATPRRDVVIDGRESRKRRERTLARFSATTPREMGRDGDSRGRGGREVCMCKRSAERRGVTGCSPVKLLSVRK